MCVEDFYKLVLEDYFLSVAVHKPPEKKAPIIVMFHGFTGHKIENRRLFVTLARRLCNEGFIVVRFDYRGHGESPFEFEDFKLKWALEDAEHVLEHILKDYKSFGDAERIGVVGLSLGGAVSAHIASKYGNRVKALVLLSPAINLNEIFSKFRKYEGEYVYFGPFRINTRIYWKYLVLTVSRWPIKLQHLHL